MPIHDEQLDGHVARITIDRPEARNSLDLAHFRDLAEAWRRFKDDADDWVAIVTGVDGDFMTGADLKTYIPQITALQEQIQAGDVEEIDGCRPRDGTDAGVVFSSEDANEGPRAFADKRDPVWRGR